MKQTATRRNFLKTTAGAAALAYFPWSRMHSQQLSQRSACDRVHRSRKHGHGRRQGHANFGDIVAVCDVDSRHADRAKNDKNIGKGKADAYKDYREVLDRQDIDVVSVVTPDHWHVKIAIEALQAGKHVFCQKPLTLTLEENQLIRTRARSMQTRSSSSALSSVRARTSSSAR